MTDRADIPVVVLCGGMGTRLREASEKLPKPLVDIGGRPVLWHIMKHYRAHGFRRFVLCLGYKGDLIKRWFLDYRAVTSDFTLDMGNGHVPHYHSSRGTEDWQVTFAETGLLTGTAARMHRAARYLEGERFLLTYGDGVGDVDLDRLLETHVSSGRLGTVTGVRPTGRYGEMHVDEELACVQEFNEKPTRADGWVSGGFFAFERAFLDRYVSDDPDEMLEHRPLRQLAADGQLGVHRHEGYWMGMDTYRDWMELNARWDRGDAPWRTWKDDDGPSDSRPLA
jgi:glucose-1-phosphate cytidylyltransferase